MKYLSLLLTFSLFISACGQSDDTVDLSNASEWLLPTDEVLNGGPGKDGIPSVDDPEFITIGEVDFLSDDDLIIVIKSGDEIKAYPHPILDWHEIVNDEIGDTKFALTYCPLTGTGIGWDRMYNGEETTFGVSGLLYNSNLIPYDRNTDSNWSQIRLDCVNGDRINEKISTVPVIEMSWETLKEMYPGSKILSTNTGFARDYSNYPYGDYKMTSGLLFNARPFDSRLNTKERVLGVIGTENVRAYRFEDFSEESTMLVADELDGEALVIFGSEAQNFLVAYKATLNGTTLAFTPLLDQGEVLAEDEEGNRWNVFGEAVSGPRTGEQLQSTESFIGYWFSWGAFYEGLSIYNE